MLSLLIDIGMQIKGIVRVEESYAQYVNKRFVVPWVISALLQAARRRCTILPATSAAC